MGSIFFFLQMEWATVRMRPTLTRMRMGHRARANWCVSLHITSPLVVAIVTGIIVD